MKKIKLEKIDFIVVLVAWIIFGLVAGIISYLALGLTYALIIGVGGGLLLGIITDLARVLLLDGVVFPSVKQLVSLTVYTFTICVLLTLFITLLDTVFRLIVTQL